MKISDVYRFFFETNDPHSQGLKKIRDLKQQHKEQLIKFETWTAEQQWEKIHHAHYDWWMFPVNRPSSAHGDRFALSTEDVNILKKDRAFMEEYRKGFALVVQAWGWDLEREKPIAIDRQNSKGQQWDGYGVRLAKMSDSARLFDEGGLHQKLRLFFHEHCIPQQDRVPISDLKWLMETLS